MKTTRDWQQIAAEASKEKDPKKLLQLTKELERALDERDKLPIRAKPSEVRKSA
jgi:hypothetical protein